MGALGIVQARLGSTRLPGKVLMPLAGKSVLERVLECVHGYCERVVVATSVDPSDDAIEQACARLGVACVRGPLADVFARFAAALARPEYADVEWFYRITADCPLHSRALSRELYLARSVADDYLYYADDELPRGMAPELVRRAAFDSVDRRSLTPDERQHVTLPFYRSGSSFRARKLQVPGELAYPELRLTLDYPEDHALLEALLSRDPQLSAELAVRQLLAQPELVELNRHRQTTAPALVQGSPA
jgi:spore coat polysaccharide biosynthesis protein SpsF